MLALKLTSDNKKKCAGCVTYFAESIPLIDIV